MRSDAVSSSHDVTWVMVVDDHPAIRAGLSALLSLDPRLIAASEAATAEAAEAIVARQPPDVAIVDYHLPDADGLELCRRLRAAEHRPEVVIFSAFADDGLLLPAALVDAFAVVRKDAAPQTLFDTLHAAAAGGQRLRPSPDLLARAEALIELQDLPILGMLADRTSATDIATVLSVTEEEVERRTTQIIERLKRPRPRAPRPVPVRQE